MSTKVTKVFTRQPSGKWVETTSISQKRQKALDSEAKRLFDEAGNFRIIAKIAKETRKP